MPSIRTTFNYALGMNISAKVSALNAKGTSVDSLASNELAA